LLRDIITEKKRFVLTFLPFFAPAAVKTTIIMYPPFIRGSQKKIRLIRKFFKAQLKAIGLHVPEVARTTVVI
jgi:hypothetical protein